jgi:hypothetical protein
MERILQKHSNNFNNHNNCIRGKQSTAVEEYMSNTVLFPLQSFQNMDNSHT